ncbi:MAG: hypothetical protein DRK00_01995 [Thermoprotei archaeon]|nr:MAG: hypothetical protein DRK00_01995 [Thermoprotei archaeon]
MGELPYNNCWREFPGDEARLAEKLAALLEEVSGVARVRANVNISSTGVTEDCAALYGEIGFLGSEVDLAIALRSGEQSFYLVGVEIKYIKPKTKGYRQLYEGLGQALLYLWLGFDASCLLLFFHPEYVEERAERISSVARGILEAGMGGVQLTSVKAKLIGGEVCLYLIESYPGRGGGAWTPYHWARDVLSKMEKYELHNPYGVTSEWKARRECLKQALRIPVI